MIESTVSNDQVTFVDYEDSNLSLFHEENFPVILLKQNGIDHELQTDHMPIHFVWK